MRIFFNFLVTLGVQTTKVSFNLISPLSTTTNPTVSISGVSPVTMVPPIAGIPQYKVDVDVPEGAVKYRYTVNGVTETFDRTLASGTTSTFNDFFNRTVTVSEVPPFPQPLQSEGITRWPLAAPLLPLFDDSYIGTFWVTGADGVTKEGGDTTVTLSIILKDRILTFPETIWSMGKADTSKPQSKFLITKNTDVIGGRAGLKLRAATSGIREKSYSELAQSLGIPVAAEHPFRVYANGNAKGLFLATDRMIDAGLGSKAHIVSQFEKGDITRPTGSFYECGGGSTFERNSEPSFIHRYGPYTPSLKSLIDVVVGLTEANVADLEKIFDVDVFLRQMVLEYLMINWDGYWGQASNFDLYVDSKGYWQFSDNDFDQTFNYKSTPGDPALSYKSFPPPLIGVTNTSRPLIDNLLKIPKYRARFEAILIATVKHTFNPVSFHRRVNAYFTKIRPEVAWDYSVLGDSAFWFTLGQWEDSLKTEHASLTGVTKAGSVMGLYSFVEARADAVAKEFGFVWDAVPIEPTLEVNDGGFTVDANGFPIPAKGNGVVSYGVGVLAMVTVLMLL